VAESNNRPSMELVSWKDVREAVYEVNAPFAEVVDQLDPSRQFRLYRARYPFGSVILNYEGVVHFPTPTGQLAPLSDPCFSSQIRDDLAYYNDVPAGVVLRHSLELAVKSANNLFPFALMQKGHIFGLWRTLDPSPTYSYHTSIPWQMTTGARCLFMLPKITDSVSYKKLYRARNIKLSLPQNLLDHYFLFKQLSEDQKNTDYWHTELIFFSMDWFKRLDDVNWLRFSELLYKEVHNKTQFWRNKFLFDVMWDYFSKELSLENINAKPYIMDMIKHIITIALGVVPGFGPLVNEEIAPIQLIQKDFIQLYELKLFVPTIIGPSYFQINESDPRPVYWSLQLPSYFETIPKPRSSKSTLEDLREIKRLIDTFVEVTHKGKIKGINNTPVEYCLNHVRFDYFHSDVEDDDEIRPTKEIPQDDPRMIFSMSPENNQFSTVSPFTRGCIRLSKLIE